jgi:hypothetical protein
MTQYNQSIRGSTVEHNITPATESGLSFSSYAKGNKKTPSSNQKANPTPEELEL